MTWPYAPSLAPYAVPPNRSGGRIHPEPEDPLRDPFALDRHRIVESTAFRRLEHKTQVFAPAFDDHIRTRLTHTLEAALIARTLAGALRANETLAEAITLAHDLGHPPFGHAGEAALQEAMSDHGGFNHNAHALRVVEYLEHPFPPFRGLNLTRETLDGLRVHKTRYDIPASPSVLPGCADVPPSAGPSRTSERNDGDAASLSTGGGSVEAQIASFADRIAYGCHDLEDAMGAGLIDLADLMTLPIWKQAFAAQAELYANRPLPAVRRPVLDAMLNRMLADAVDHSTARLEPIRSPDQARASAAPLVAASPSLESEWRRVEAFLAEKVYRHPDIARYDDQGRTIILTLFEAYVHDPSLLPPRFVSRIDEQGVHRVICDYIAGMTDRFCMSAYERITGH